MKKIPAKLKSGKVGKQNSSNDNLERYAAFLRGINIGGHKKVPMADLKKMLEKIGFSNVQTILASGNVVFDSAEKNLAAIKETIEKKINEVFGFQVKTIIHSMNELKSLVSSDPFKGIEVTKETRLYVTFLSHKPKSTFKAPYQTPDKLFQILKATDYALFGVLSVKDAHSVDAMNFIDKEFGKEVTTRNWNTIVKVAALG
ncbi:MAG: DUF1697 domain-containing protein [Ignavibacteriales bacterium]|nr:DUF1697 domain-containing protein [Ignavibacteriales bacterium]